MNFPNLPTDNLYKFMAIIGLVSIISTVVLIYSLAEKIYISSNQAIIAENADTLQFKMLTSEFNYLSAYIPIAPKIQLENLSKEKNQADITLQNLIEKNAKDETLFNPNWVKLQIIIIYSLAIVGTGGGFLLSIFGFVLWYIKLQKYQDILIKNEINKSKRSK